MEPPSVTQLSRPPRRVWQLALALITLALTAWGFRHWSQVREERKLFAALEPYFTSEAADRYRSLPLSHRLETARRALPALEALRDTSWGISVTGLQERDDEKARELVYELTAGDTDLLNCTVAILSGNPTGSCARFQHLVPASSPDGAGAPRLQEIPLELHLSAPPYAESASEARLKLGNGTDAQVAGTIRVDAQDVTVQDPVILVPKPFAPEQLEAVSIKDFSPRRETTLRSVSSSPYYAKLPMPALLGPFFGNEPELEVMYAEGALAVDLTGDAPVYRYEGGLRLLRNNIGRGVVEYVPGQYASVAITEALIPSALPQVCIKMNQALAELDFTRKSLRVAGSMEIESVDSFLCPRTSIGQEMGFFTRTGLGFALGAARDGLGLPSRITSRGHFLFDLDDGIVCGDVAVNGYSLFHAAYLGNANTFQMWAPRGFMADDIRPGRPLGSFWDLGVGAFTADWAFPASNPRQCWDEDPGPRIDLERSILTDWRSETASLESSELY